VKDCLSPMARLDLRQQIDQLRNQLQENVFRKIKFTGEVSLIKFAREELNLDDTVTPYLEHQRIKLKKVLMKLLPLDFNDSKVHPMRVAGILSKRPNSVLAQHEVESFKRDMVKQHDRLE